MVCAVASPEGDARVAGAVQGYTSQIAPQYSLGVSGVRYLLLVRHASHRHGALTAEGESECAEVGSALREVLRQLLGSAADEPRACITVLHATSQEATRTAELLTREVDGHLDCHPLLQLDNPADGMIAGGPDLRDRVAGVARALTERQVPVTIAIGHLPLLSWIIEEITGSALPMGRAELLAIELGISGRERPLGRFRWALTPGARGKQLMTELRDKIKSKMDAAKFLATFVTATLGLQLGLTLDPARFANFVGKAGGAAVVLAIAGLFLVTSAGLFFATIFAYDKLLMPVELWADQRPRRTMNRPGWLVWRPPSSAVWILLQNMQRVWRYFFTSAACLLISALTLELGVVLWNSANSRNATAAVLAMTGLLVIAVVLLFKAAWPRLGSED